jgi:hypothetical protein
MIEIASKKYNQELEYNSTLEARLCAIVLTANGHKKSNKKAYSVSDFMPVKKSTPKTPEQYEELAKAAAIKMGGHVEFTI